ncbi:prenylcysteine oxidase 1-like isoform X1 [Clavelina lepadiformis]|uniref:prenylcysteine oxidase 1-like isoform X1 n=1 Tax=Clavelina lepadiformis TaxID=159417 RepID=UPI0040414394
MMIGKWFKLKSTKVGVISLLLIGAGFTRFSEAGSTDDVDLKSTSFIASLKNDARMKARRPPQRVAVVGGGIGGSSATYFLRHLFGNDVKVDLFEPSGRLCGRVATVDVAGRSYESGGSVIHDKNFYAKAIAKNFGLKEVNDDTGNGRLGFFDGEEYVLETSPWYLITLFRMLWAFGLDLFRLKSVESEFMNKFIGIYNLHKQGQSFSSVKDLLHATGGDTFVNSTEITSCELFREKGIGDRMIDWLVNGGLRANYGQDCHVNGFVGCVSMAGIQSTLWAVDGGNKQLCEKLVESSKCNVLSERVTTVRKTSSGRFSVDTENTTNRFYDLVVIATPINRDKSKIDVSGACGEGVAVPSATEDKRHYRRTVATFVKGKLNRTLFNCDSLQSCPESSLMTNGNLFYRSVGLHVPVNFDLKKGDTIETGVYKVFSTSSLSNEQIATLFEGHSEVKEVDWFAYPQYQPPDRLETFVLNREGLYYVSPVEWAASAIEMSLISAKNVALLAFNNWYGIEENIYARGKNQKSKDKSEL